jgi:hypothetical protein
MDAAIWTFIGVAIGSVVSLLTNYQNNRNTLKKEEAQWKRDKESRDIERTSQDLKDKSEKRGEYIHKIIELTRESNALFYGSDDFKLRETKKQKISGEILGNSIKLLSVSPEIRHDKKFMEVLRKLQNNDLDAYYGLETRLMEVISEDISERNEIETIKFIITLDKEYWTSEFIKGENLRDNSVIEIDIFKISASQRKILTLVYPSITDVDYFSRLDSLYLRLPTEKDGKIVFEENWMAKIDPKRPYREIIETWEIEFKHKFEQLDSQGFKTT